MTRLREFLRLRALRAAWLDLEAAEQALYVSRRDEPPTPRRIVLLDRVDAIEATIRRLDAA